MFIAARGLWAHVSDANQAIKGYSAAWAREKQVGGINKTRRYIADKQLGEPKKCASDTFIQQSTPITIG